MIPYSNRIEYGRFAFDGVTYQLEDAAHHAIHGDVRFREWEIEEASATHLGCAISSAAFADRNWPWPYEARVEYRVQGNVFASRLRLWNRGETAMPAGFGWHPFYRRSLTRDGETVRLQMKVQAAYPDAHGNRIPSGPAEPVSAAQDFSLEKPLLPDHFLDTCFRGYDGRGHIAWPESGIKLSFRCSSACTHLVIYNPTGQPYFAVEPVTNANNGVNLHSHGDAGSGIVRPDSAVVRPDSAVVRRDSGVVRPDSGVVRPDSGVVRLLPGQSLEATFEQQVEACEVDPRPLPALQP
jgi:aldose 1-epimerase